MVSVCVIGMGYVGLPTALILASRGYRVSGYDIDKALVAKLSRGVYGGKEESIGELLKSVLSTGKFTVDHQIMPADVYFICVPTPIDEQHKKPDMTAVNDAVSHIEEVISPGALVILESTSPVGTTESIYKRVNKKIQEKLASTSRTENKRIFAAYCPERVKPGQVIKELTALDRVIGGCNTKSSNLAKEIFSKMTSGECVTTSAQTAEFIKLAENSFRDVNIAFANELRNLCVTHAVDADEVRNLANLHPRVNILQSGIGVGGHCIPVDPWFLVNLYEQTSTHSSIIKSARKINDQQIEVVTAEIIDFCNKSNASKVALMGMTYKADVDDFRGSPSIKVAKRLQECSNFVFVVCDPSLPEGTSSFGLKCQSLEEIVGDGEIDVFIFLVAHSSFDGTIQVLRKENKNVLQYF